MPDFAMCDNHECPLAKECYRHEAVPSNNQAWMHANPNNDPECPDFWVFPASISGPRKKNNNDA